MKWFIGISFVCFLCTPVFAGDFDHCNDSDFKCIAGVLLDEIKKIEGSGPVNCPNTKPLESKTCQKTNAYGNCVYYKKTYIVPRVAQCTEECQKFNAYDNCSVATSCTFLPDYCCFKEKFCTAYDAYGNCSTWGERYLCR